MCALCRREPCDPRCPNSPEPIPVYRCKICGEGIFEGDRYLDIGGEKICEMCMDEMPVDEVLELFGEVMKTA